MRSTTDPIGWARVIGAFALLFALYQTSEWWQTIHDPESAIGPALMLACLVVAWPLGRWLGWLGYDAYGLDRFPRWWLWVAGGLAAAGLAKLATLVFGPGQVSMTGAQLGLAGVLIAFVTTLVPSLVEDILTRGFLLRTIPVRLGGVAFVLASAALYTLNHVWRLDWGITEQVRLFCLGLAYGAAAWRLRSLWGAVALHWGWNLANALSGPLVDVEGASADATRLYGAAVHLVLLGLVMLVPLRIQQASD